MLPVRVQNFLEIAAGHFVKDTNVLSKFCKIILSSATIDISIWYNISIIGITLTLYYINKKQRSSK